MHEQLKDKLKQLQQSLTGINQLDNESRQLLQQLDDEIHMVLKGQRDREATLNDRIEQQAVEFDGQYPQTSAILRDIVEVLGKIGI